MLHKRLRLLLLLALGGALLLFGAGIASAIVSFSDVPQDHRFHHEIMSLANANVVDGYSDGTFRPGEPVLRQQMAKMIVLATKSHTEPVDNEANPTFPDVSPGDGIPYPFDYVEEAAAAGYFRGDDAGLFNRYANITRSQLALVVVRAGGSALEDPPAGYDPGLNDLPAYAADEIAKAQFNGILSGYTDGTFRPYESATRGHVSKMIGRVMDLMGGGAPMTAGAVSGVSDTPEPEMIAMAEHLDGVLGLGYNTVGTTALAKVLFDDNPANDPFILDTREPADFAEGHIPGAVNIPLQDVPQALIDGDPRIPGDKDIVVASYWGNDGDFINVLLNAYRIIDPAAQQAAEAAQDSLPFPVSRVLFQGMTSWTFDRGLVPAGTRFDDAIATGVSADDEPVESGEVTPTDAGAYPAFADFETADAIEQILIRAKHYLNSVPEQTDLHIYPADLVELMEDEDPGNDPQIVSVRAPVHYTMGHIPGAINIHWKQTANLDLVKNVDPTAPLVAYCYTGHTGGAGTMTLGILGYENARNLLYGMNGWNTSAPASGQLRDFDLMRTWDFPLNDGSTEDLDSMADYERPVGCEGCHGELTGIFVDREVVDPPLAQAAPPSEGEG